MSAGMAAVIRAHVWNFNIMGCICGRWDKANSSISHADHIANELTKAGFGKVR